MSNPLDPPMEDYAYEERGLPKGFPKQEFVNQVITTLEDFGGPPSPALAAVVIGRLVLDGNIDTSRSDFRFAVKSAYDVGVTETAELPNKTHYDRISSDFSAIRPARQKIRFQELSAVADHVIASSDEGWNIKDQSVRRAQVEVGMIRYADGTIDTGYSSLDLPPIISEDASNQEIEPPNVRAVAMCAAAYECEQTGALDVVDKMLELFMNGMLPVRDDSGGRALNRYYWQADSRLDPTSRAIQFARILGKGDTGSIDAQANTQFESLLMRFVSALVRYDSNLQVSTVVTSDGKDRVGSSEQVRKAAQDFAANASLYGWGFTIFAARKLSQQIDLVFDVLGQETLQRAYGVTGPWQLVERVSAVELGSTPSIVQHRTRAKAIKDLLDILARYAKELSRSGAQKRFLPNIGDFRSNSRTDKPTVDVPTYTEMVTAAHNLLAVGGVTDDQIDNFAIPVASVARESIPVVGGDGDGPATANIDQIRQLAQQGQFDQLQQLLAASNGHVR
jgi:hypothetical protein